MGDVFYGKIKTLSKTKRDKIKTVSVISTNNSEKIYKNYIDIE